MVERSIQLILGTSNSLPLGTSEADLEAAYTRAYRPLLRCMYKYPRLNFTLSYSGYLLEWLDKQHSEFIVALSEIQKLRHGELLLSAYYDPLLPLIPRPDRIGQLEHTSTLLRRLFGRRIRGAWVNQQIWEADLPSSYFAAGLNYAFLDDWHFCQAGLNASECFLPCITEDQGKALVVFPVHNRLRNRAWFEDPESVVNEVLELANEHHNRIVSLILPGEDGPWDAASEEERRTQWLDRFLQLVSQKQDQRIIETVLPGRYLRRAVGLRRIYLPATRFSEMTAASSGPNLNGEVRQSIALYPEINQLYCKMQYVNSLVSQVRGDKYRKQAAKEEVWKAQNHGSYWYGLHAGIHRIGLRKATYRTLLKAERQTREKGIFAPSLFQLDFDLDGLPEILYQGNEINAYMHLKGARLFSMDYMINPQNYVDDGAASFIDHFLTPTTSLDSFVASSAQDAYNPTRLLWVLEDLRKESASVRFSCDLLISDPRGHRTPVRIKKHYSFSKASIFVEYQISNQGILPVELRFAPELNFSFASYELSDLRIWRKELRTRSEELNLTQRDLPISMEVFFEDLATKAVLHAHLSQSAEWWMFPRKRKFFMKGKEQEETQAVCLIPHWDLTLGQGESFSLGITLSVTRFRN